ncbi:MAG: hypothetical protein NZ530_06270 [Thermodesulfobacteriaceae bacterium]|nr:hypothetical protein [Thermodesulfobacteriaceae bacterium]MCX8041649.1 hypothetical protein [Thermodesulfobacteriaceae bacterium]MDW8136080.1 hypothetical protein [Thermodesulfobacterium sp.]
MNKGSLRFYKDFDQAEEDIVFQKPTLENLRRRFEVFSLFFRLSKPKPFKRGLIFYKSIEDFYKEE